MKKLLIILIAATTLTGCHQQYVAKHKNEICATCPSEHNNSSVYIEKWKTDTIYRVSKIDSLIIVARMTADCNGKKVPCNADTVLIVNEKYYLHLWSENSNLKMTLRIMGDSIAEIIKTKETSDVKTETKTITKTEVKKAGRFYVWFFWIVAMLAVLWLILKLWLWKYVKWIDSMTR